MRRLPTLPIKRCFLTQVSTWRRQRDKHLKTWITVMRENLLNLDIIDVLWDDRVAWKARIHIADAYKVRNEL